VTATPLRCPHCAAEFDFAGWQKAAACPACGRRVRFEEAVAAAADVAGATAGAEAGTAAAQAAVVTPLPAGAARPTPPSGDVTPAPAAAVAPAAFGESADDTRYFLGKPLGWTRAWTVVVLVWAVAASGLVVARIEAGHSAVFTPREQASIAAVQRTPLETGVTYDEALRRVEKQLGVSSASARWYVQDQAWRKALAVHCVLGQDDLSWTVSYGGRVAVDPGTASILKELMKAKAAQPGGLPGLPQIPSL
jgi:DNA-directed RNA polymerase subunit RPC12/RpoP